LEAVPLFPPPPSNGEGVPKYMRVTAV